MDGGFVRIHSEADFDHALELIEAECCRQDGEGGGLERYGFVCHCAVALHETEGVYICPNVLARLTATVVARPLPRGEPSPARRSPRSRPGSGPGR